jgi:hypothetical protein
MKYFIFLSLLTIIASFPACCWKKKQCCPQPIKQEEVVEKRASGPLSEKNVKWDEQDYK